MIKFKRFGVNTKPYKTYQSILIKSEGLITSVCPKKHMEIKNDAAIPHRFLS